MQKTVVSSPRGRDALLMDPFAGDPECLTMPSTFEVMFFSGGVRYQYGFSATSEKITGEWLFAWPRGRVQVLFERDDDEFVFGQKLTGPKKVWKDATRPDALLLSTAAALNSEQFKPVFDWFRETLKVTETGSWNSWYTIEQCRGGSPGELIDKSDIVDFLKKADLSIKDIRIEEEEIATDMIRENVPVEHKRDIGRSLAGKRQSKVVLVHDTGNENGFELDYRAESNGTQKLFRLAGPWLNVLRRGSIVVVDELEIFLHASIIKFLIDCFHNPSVNKFGAQLIFATHNTSILNQDTFRRDQIWFCERNKGQETRLYPLTEFHPRKKFENLERSYLTGRYGAIPYLVPIDEPIGQ